jgi:3-deoxy-D-manno-octulosonic-acid transferase
MRTLYSIIIHCYNFFLHLASLFHPKAGLWVNGRKDIFKKLELQLSQFDSERSVIWFHCASLGEFEQGRPLMEKYRSLKPESVILLTFFSPSGYEIRKNYPGADVICYLPIDTPASSKRFLDIVKPSTAIFVKYEFWFNYLNELKKRRIPTYLVSGIFRNKQHFFKPYGAWFRKQLNNFSHFYLQDKHSEELIHSIGYRNVTVVGDTRFDRVSEIAKDVKQFPLIESFNGSSPIIIAGSTWPQDEEQLAELELKNYKLIIAPHEIDENHISSIESIFGKRKINTIRFSKVKANNIQTYQVLVIDNIGMLSSLYQYGTIAYIGGGFGKGIHNILEAATFGLPVIFGPNYHKFAEAVELANLGGAFPVNTKEDLVKNFLLLQNADVLKTASHISKYYVESRTGATDKILSAILK